MDEGRFQGGAGLFVLLAFEAVLFSDGGVKLAYGIMGDSQLANPGELSWSPESVGYESQDGAAGFQISYEVVPASNTAYYIPPSCHDPNAAAPPTPAPPAPLPRATCAPIG